MKVTVTIEHRFARLPDGTVWTPSSFAYSFWTRYLDVFDSVRIVSRASEVKSVPENWLRTDGDSVEIGSIPYFLGPVEFARNWRSIRSAIDYWVDDAETVILRAASTIANMAATRLREKALPYGVEVLCDPWDVFGPGVVKHPLRPFFRRWFARHLRRQCQEASAVAYVTQRTLQERYPAAAAARAFAVSDVVLSESSFRPRQSIRSGSQPIRLITVGSLAQPYKGVDVLLKSFAKCIKMGANLQLTVVGDGRYRADLETLTAKLGLTERVQFLGQLAGHQAVSAELERADLFVMASLTEGLPRAMIEAMAQGLPCIGSRVGGIPELLGEDNLVAPGSSEALANKLLEVTRDERRMRRMSEENVLTASEYREDRLRAARVEFLQVIRTTVEHSRQSGEVPMAVPAQ